VAETSEQRHNPELIELLNELRVALPGVQVLFAFLLAVPLANGFPKLSQTGRDVYFAAFIATALSIVLLIAPSSYHRLRGDSTTRSGRSPSPTRLFGTTRRNLDALDDGVVARLVRGVARQLRDRVDNVDP
jgi:Family of unknown function (DUF6328)